MRAFSPALPPARRIRSWNPSRIRSLRQRFLDVLREYYSSTLNSYQILTPEESGTVAVPRAGRCFLFDGTDDYAESTALTAALGSRQVDFTITARVKRSVPAAGSILSRYKSVTSHGLIFIFAYSGTEFSYYMSKADGTFQKVTYSTPPTLNVWHSLSVSVSGSLASPAVTLGCDGVYETFTPAALSASPDTTVRCIIGATNNGGINDFCAMSLRDLRVHTVAKSQAELTAIANQELTPDTVDTTGILAHYWCETESGLTEYDCTGNGHNLTLMNVDQETFHATDSGVTYSAANECGHSLGRQLTSAGRKLISAVQSASLSSGSFAAVMRLDSIANATVWQVHDLTIRVNSSGKLERYLGGWSEWPSAQVLSANTNYSLVLTWNGTSHGAFIDGVSQGVLSSALPLVESGYAFHVFSRPEADTELFQGSFFAARLYSTALTAGQSSFANWPTTGIVSNWIGGSSTSLTDTVGSNTLTATTGSVPQFVIPRNESTPTLDVLGNTLQYAGPIKLPATTEVPCVTGDGTAAYVDLGSPLIPATADFTLSFWVNGCTAESSIVSQQSGSYLIVYISSSGNIQILSSLGNSSSINIGTGWVFVTLARSGSTFTLTASGASASITSASAVVQANTQLLANNASNLSPCKIASLSITTGGVTKYVKLQEGPGSDSTNRTVYIVGSDGSTSTGTITGGTVSNIWANRNPYGRDHQIGFGGRLTTQNLLTYSEQFDNAAWNKQDSSVTANSVTSPDGTTTADTVTLSTGSAYVELANAVTVTSGAAYTFSVYLKANAVSSVKLQWYDTGYRARATFDLSAVTATATEGTAAVTSVGSGWYRCSITGTTGSTSGRCYLVSTGTTGTFYAWGSQLNTGTTAADYQPTTASAVPANVFIPAKLDGSACADGRAITLQAGTSQNPGTRIAANTWNAPSLTRLKVPALWKELPCVTGDGSAVVIDFGVVLPSGTSDFTFGGWFYRSGTTTERLFDSRDNAGTAELVIFANATGGGTNAAGSMGVYAFGGSLQITASSCLTNNAWNRFDLTRSGNNWTLTVESVTATGTSSASLAASSKLVCGGFNSGGTAVANACTAGRLADLQITTGGLTTYIPLTDGLGTAGTNRDLAWFKSDGTYGVITNAIVGGTIGSIWANTTQGKVPFDHPYALPAIVPRYTKFGAADGSRFFNSDIALGGTNLTNALEYTGPATP